MNKIVSLLILLTLVTFNISAKEVTSKINYKAPNGFQIMSPEGVRLRYPNSKNLKVVYSNDSGETTIAIGTKENTLKQSEIEEARKMFETSFRKRKGLEVKSSKVVQLNGLKWVQIEYTSPTIDYVTKHSGVRVYNIMLATGTKDSPVVIFNLSSSMKEFKKYEPVLRKSIQSISLRPQHNS